MESGTTPTLEIRKADCRAGLSGPLHAHLRTLVHMRELAHGRGSASTALNEAMLLRSCVWFSLACGGAAASSAVGAPASSGAPSAVTHITHRQEAVEAPGGVSGLLTPAQQYLYLRSLHEVFGDADPVPAKVFRIPFLGVEPSALPEEATVLLTQPTIAMSAAHDRVVCVCAHTHMLRYAPQVANLALILLRFLSESEVFTMLHSLLTHNGAARMLVTSRREETALVKCLRTLVKAYFPKLSEHVEGLGQPVRAILAAWMRSFFSGYLPAEDTYRVVDAYLYEGPKVLLRYALALLKCLKRRLKSASTAAEFDLVCRRYVSRHVLLSSSVAAAHPKLASPQPPDAGVAALAAAFRLSERAVRDVLAIGHDPAVPTPYSFEHLQTTAFKGIVNLSRETIDSLMTRYMGGGTHGSVAAFGSPGLSVGDALGHASTPAHRTSAAARSTPSTRSDDVDVSSGTQSDSGEEPIMQRVVCAAQNAVLTVPEKYSHAAVSDIERKTEAPSHSTPSVDDDSSTPAWRSTKLVGIGSRLMSVDFATPTASALRERIRHAAAAAQSKLYSPVPLETSVATRASDAPVTSASLAVSTSPHLASLSTLFPERVSLHHWACLYSTDTHGWSLHTLYNRTSGCAPCFVVVQLASRTAGASVAEHASAAVSKLITAVSSKRPVLGFYSTNGLPVAASGSGTAWCGHSEDFAFQLYPELSCFNVSTADGAAAAHDLSGDGHRIKLKRSHFLMCTTAALCVGGDPSRAGASVLQLPEDLHVAKVSRELLLDLSVPGVRSGADSAAVHDTVDMDILAVEAYGFIDGRGQLATRLPHTAIAAARDLSAGGASVPAGIAAEEMQRAAAHIKADSAYRETLRKWWIEDGATK